MSRPGAVVRRMLTLCVGGAVLLGACAQVPDEGPVVDGAGPEVDAAAPPFDFSPPGPLPGATPDQVVAGFLTALQASPMSTKVAREYLTARAGESWQPDQGTLLYGGLDLQSTPGGSGRSPLTVPVTLRRVFALDRAGRWDGRQRDTERSGLQLQVTREQGEWRVVDPPEVLVLPLTHFENRYRRFAVHFSDPTGSVLVPEPVYLPMDRQTPTQLVEALLAGPEGGTRGVDRTFLPPGTALEVSVPVAADGVAQVPLTAEVRDLGRRELTVAAAQLAWTLRQVPEVTAFRLVVDGDPVTVPGIGDVVPVDSLEAYSPVVATASPDLYGLRGRAVRRVTDGAESTLLELPAGTVARDLSVSLLGNPVAVTTTVGEVRVLARGAARAVRAEPVTTVPATPGTHVLWDWSRALWLVPPDLDDGVRVLLGGRLRTLAWASAGARGRTVEAASLSRDGSRLALALRRPGGGTDLVVARVQRAADQSRPPVALRPGRVVAAGVPLAEVVDLGWRDAQTLAVLVRRDRLRAQVLAVPVDGSAQSRVLTDHSDILFGRAIALAASPADGAVRVTTADGDVHALTAQGRWQSLDVGTPLRLPTFVG